MSAAQSQGTYQVRFDWGARGAEAIAAGAHVVVWVDQLAAAGDIGGTSGELMPLLGGSPGGVELMPAILEEAANVASFCFRRQTELGDRFVIAVVAAGRPVPTEASASPSRISSRPVRSLTRSPRSGSTTSPRRRQRPHPLTPGSRAQPVTSSRLP